MSAYARDWNANMAKIAAAKFRINAHGWLDVNAVLGTEYIFKPHHFILQKNTLTTDVPITQKIGFTPQSPLNLFKLLRYSTYFFLDPK